MLKVTIKSTNIELTEAITSYIAKKIASLDKYLQSISSPQEAFVEVGKITRHHRKGPVFRVEVDIRLPKRIIRAETTGYGLYDVIDIVKDELKRKIMNFRGEIDAKYKRGSRLAKKMRSFSKESLSAEEVDPSVRHRQEG